MIRRLFVLLIVVLWSATACQRQSSVCPAGSIGYFDAGAPPAPPDTTMVEISTEPLLVEIRGRETEVGRIIHGPICADHWSGVVYVACDIEIAAWDDAPRFFEHCPLTIEPDSVIYVAAHNDTAYYKGCSCHEAQAAPE